MPHNLADFHRTTRVRYAPPRAHRPPTFDFRLRQAMHAVDTQRRFALEVSLLRLFVLALLDDPDERPASLTLDGERVSSVLIGSPRSGHDAADDGAERRKSPAVIQAARYSAFPCALASARCPGRATTFRGFDHVPVQRRSKASFEFRVDKVCDHEAASGNREGHVPRRRVARMGKDRSHSDIETQEQAKPLDYPRKRNMISGVARTLTLCPVGLNVNDRFSMRRWACSDVLCGVDPRGTRGWWWFPKERIAALPSQLSRAANGQRREATMCGMARVWDGCGCGAVSLHPSIMLRV